MVRWRARRARELGGAALVVALVLLWGWGFRGRSGVAAFWTYLGAMFAIGGVGGGLMRSRRALVVVPLAVVLSGVLSSAVLLSWAYLTGSSGPYTESSWALTVGPAAVLYGGVAALGAGLGALVSRRVVRSAR